MSMCGEIQLSSVFGMRENPVGRSACAMVFALNIGQERWSDCMELGRSPHWNMSVWWCRNYHCSMSHSSVGGGSLYESPYKIDGILTSRMTVTQWLPGSESVGKAVLPASTRIETLMAIFVYVLLATSESFSKFSDVRGRPLFRIRHWLISVYCKELVEGCHFDDECWTNIFWM
jgi:hypothetical protein